MHFQLDHLSLLSTTLLAFVNHAHSYKAWTEFTCVNTHQAPTTGAGGNGERICFDQEIHGPSPTHTYNEETGEQMFTYAGGWTRFINVYDDSLEGEEQADKEKQGLQALQPEIQIIVGRDDNNVCTGVTINGQSCNSCFYCGSSSSHGNSESFDVVGDEDTYSADCTNIPNGRNVVCEGVKPLFYPLLTEDAATDGGDSTELSRGDYVSLLHPVEAATAGAGSFDPRRSYFVGCFREGDEFGIHFRHQYAGDSSFSECLQGCAEEDYLFAGLQGGQCLCGFDIDGLLSEADGNCNIPCSDSGSDNSCGGDHAASIYATGISLEPTRMDFIGCFLDDRSTHVMDYRLVDELSIDECIRGCAEAEFLFAGLRDGRHCFCASEFYSTTIVEGENCNTPCHNGPGICGGEHANSIYLTGVSMIEQTREDYIGCFKDVSGDVMNFQLDDVLSIDECIEGCAREGFLYAGLQAGRHCFCGLDGEYDKLGEANNCDALCHNDESGTCGGNWANSVYETASVSLSDLENAANRRVLRGATP